MENAYEMKSMEYFLVSEYSDQFLGFEYPNSADGVAQIQPIKPNFPTKITDCSSEDPFEIDFTSRTNIDLLNSRSSYAISTPSFTNSASSSSLEVGVGLDGSILSDVSHSFMRNMSRRENVASQIKRIDREARVLRYKEKRERRKFNKTIRYASRKAYAETRPRIKGRFVKRS